METTETVDTINAAIEASDPRARLVMLNIREMRNQAMHAEVTRLQAAEDALMDQIEALDPGARGPVSSAEAELQIQVDALSTLSDEIESERRAMMMHAGSIGEAMGSLGGMG